MNSDEITISKEEYYKLQCDSLKLAMLECGGVDNWNGYSESLYDEPPYEDGKDYDELCEEIRKSIYNGR